MSVMDMERDLNSISKLFKLGEFNLQTISNLVVYIREHRRLLTPEQAALLLEIPINVLKNDVELKKPAKWKIDNADYFGGNITWVSTKYFDELKKKFYSANFELGDIIDIAEHVKNDYDNLSSASEFLLRNVEVVIRDDVDLTSYSNFHDSGAVFSKYIDKAIGI